MRKYLLISLLSSILTFFIALYVFSPDSLRTVVNTFNPTAPNNPDYILNSPYVSSFSEFLFYKDSENPGSTVVADYLNSLNPFYVQEAPPTEDYTVLQMQDRNADYLKTLRPDTELKGFVSLRFAVPKDWVATSTTPQLYKVVSPSNNTIEINYFDLNKVNLDSINYSELNLTKKTLTDLNFAETGYNYPSNVNADSVMIYTSSLQKNEEGTKIAARFKEFPKELEVISTMDYSNVNTVVYLNNKDLFVIEANFNKDTNEQALFSDLSYLEIFIESLQNE